MPGVVRKGDNFCIISNYFEDILEAFYEAQI